MKKLIIAAILIISPTILLAEDNWHIGAGLGINVNTGSNSSSGIAPNVSDSDITDFIYSLYLTHADNLDFTYKIGFNNREIYGRDTSPSFRQQLISANVIYNIVNTPSGWFVDAEAGITSPTSVTSALDGTTLIEGQKDTGTHFGVGFGKTFSHSWTLRIAIGLDTSSTLFVDGADITPNDEIYSQLDFIYTW